MRQDTDVQDDRTATLTEGSALVHLEGSGYKVADGGPDVRGWEVTGSDGRRIGEVDDLLIDPAALRARYLEVRLDHGLLEGSRGSDVERAEEAAAAEPGLAGPAEQGLPELDSLRNTDEGVIGQAVVPGVMPPATLSGSIEEYVVRSSISDLENELTAGRHIGEHPYPGEEHILVPIGRARLDADEDRVLVDLRAEDALLLPPYKWGELTPELEERLRRAFGGTPTGTEGVGHDLDDEDRFYHPRRNRRP